jgi:hypothetical protein
LGAKAERLNLLPLHLDATNPSPSQGWAQHERKGMRERGPADAVLALAFVHHLAVAKNVPLDFVVEWIVDLARAGVIEFVQKDDPMARTRAHPQDRAGLRIGPQALLVRAMRAQPAAAYALAGALLAAAPLVAFLGTNGYPFLSAEAAVLLAACLGAGALMSLAAAPGTTPAALMLGAGAASTPAPIRNTSIRATPSRTC